MVEVMSDFDHDLMSVRQGKLKQSEIKMHKEQFVLFGVIISANMIRPYNQSVQFEVSIG